MSSPTAGTDTGMSSKTASPIPPSIYPKQDQPAHKLFPWVHITLSNLKRFLLGTHHTVENKHLKRYVAEFNYRLNRRTMEQDLAHPPAPRMYLHIHHYI